MVGKVTRIFIPYKYNVHGDFPVDVLPQSKYPKESQAFIDVLVFNEGQSILGKYGFIPARGEEGRQV